MSSSHATSNMSPLRSGRGDGVARRKAASWPPKPYGGRGSEPPTLTASLTGDEALDAHDACTPASQSRVALDSLARRYQGRHAFALCAGARASGAPRLLAQPAPARGVSVYSSRWPTGEQDQRSFGCRERLHATPRITDLVHLAKIRWRIGLRLPRAQGRDRNRWRATTRAAAGSAFTTTAPSPSPPMPFLVARASSAQQYVAAGHVLRSKLRIAGADRGMSARSSRRFPHLR